MSVPSAIRRWFHELANSMGWGATVYKGSLDCSSNPNYPAADAGDLYIVSVAGKIGGGSGATVDVGDEVYCHTDGTLAGTQAGVGSNWDIVPRPSSSDPPDWGDIGGDINDQTDLATALGGKADALGADDNYVTDDEKTILGNITVTQAVDLDQIESDTATNNAKVTNATHTGEVTGDTALTVNKTAITGRNEVTPDSDDYVLLSDTSDSGNLKKGLVSALMGGNGDITADTAWNAKGDQIVATGNNTAEILPVGNDGEVQVADSGETTGTKWQSIDGLNANSYSADHTLVAGDKGKEVRCTGSCDLITLDDTTTLGADFVCSVYNSTATPVVIADGGMTVRNRSGISTLVQYSHATIRAVDTDEYVIEVEDRKRTGTTTSSATPTINTDNVDYYSLTAQAVDITSFTTNLSGTPNEGDTLWISITGTAARAITWGSSFEASTVMLPTTTVSTNRLDVGFVWNSATSKWRCVAAV